MQLMDTTAPSGVNWQRLVVTWDEMESLGLFSVAKAFSVFRGAIKDALNSTVKDEQVLDRMSADAAVSLLSRLSDGYERIQSGKSLAILIDPGAEKRASVSIKTKPHYWESGELNA